MRETGSATDRHGRTWTARVLTHDEAEAEDLRFWLEEMTPEKRVAAVGDCLLGSLEAQGIEAVPRLRKVIRVVGRPSRPTAPSERNRSG